MAGLANARAGDGQETRGPKPTGAKGASLTYVRTYLRTYVRTYVFCRCVSAPNLLLSLLHPTPWRTYVFSYVTPPTVNLRTKGECCPGNGPRARPGPGEGDIVGGGPRGERAVYVCFVPRSRLHLLYGLIPFRPQDPEAVALTQGGLTMKHNTELKKRPFSQARPWRTVVLQHGGSLRTRVSPVLRLGDRRFPAPGCACNPFPPNPCDSAWCRRIGMPAALYSFSKR